MIDKFDYFDLECGRALSGESSASARGALKSRIGEVINSFDDMVNAASVVLASE